MSKVETAVRKRKPPARRSDVVIALMDERLLIVESYAVTNDNIQPHVVRLFELMDELKRSLGKTSSDSNDVE